MIVFPMDHTILIIAHFLMFIDIFQMVYIHHSSTMFSILCKLVGFDAKRTISFANSKPFTQRVESDDE